MNRKCKMEKYFIVVGDESFWVQTDDEEKLREQLRERYVHRFPKMCIPESYLLDKEYEHRIFKNGDFKYDLEYYRKISEKSNME